MVPTTPFSVTPACLGLRVPAGPNSPGSLMPQYFFKQQGSLPPFHCLQPRRLEPTRGHHLEWVSSAPGRVPATLTRTSSAPHSLTTLGHRAQNAGRTQLEDPRELVARSAPHNLPTRPAQASAPAFPTPPPTPTPSVLTLAWRHPGALRSLWLRQGSQRQRGSGALQSTPTARSQRQPAAPARSTRHTALPTRAAAGGGPRIRPPPRPLRAAGLASGAGHATRGPTAAPRRPTGAVLCPSGGRQAPGVPARPPKPRAPGPGAPRGRTALAEGSRTAGVALRLPRLQAEGAEPGHAGESLRADTSPSGAAPVRGRPIPRTHTHPHTPTPTHTLPPTHTHGTPAESHNAHPVQAHASHPPTPHKNSLYLARTHTPSSTLGT